MGKDGYRRIPLTPQSEICLKSDAFVSERDKLEVKAEIERMTLFISTGGREPAGYRLGNMGDCIFVTLSQSFKDTLHHPKDDLTLARSSGLCIVGPVSSDRSGWVFISSEYMGQPPLITALHCGQPREAQTPAQAQPTVLNQTSSENGVEDMDQGAETSIGEDDAENAEQGCSGRGGSPPQTSRQGVLGSKPRPGGEGRKRHSLTGAVGNLVLANKTKKPKGGDLVFAGKTKKPKGSKPPINKTKGSKVKKPRKPEKASGVAKVPKRLLWCIAGCNCDKIKHRCGTRDKCVLLPLYAGHEALIAFPSLGKDANIKNLDLKFLVFLAISLNPKRRVEKKRGGRLLDEFPFRVKPEKSVAWLTLIRKVEEEHPGLGQKGTEHDDVFLNWIKKEMADPRGKFQSRLRECLMDHAG